MRFDVHHYHYFADGDPVAGNIVKKLESFMGAIADKINAKIDAATTSFNTALGRVNGDLAALRSTIDDLKAQIAVGNLSDEEEAAIEKRIEDLTSMADGLDPSNPAVVPTDNPTP